MLTNNNNKKKIPLLLPTKQNYFTQRAHTIFPPLLTHTALHNYSKNSTQLLQKFYTTPPKVFILLHTCCSSLCLTLHARHKIWPGHSVPAHRQQKNAAAEARQRRHRDEPRRSTAGRGQDT